jgi:hypothetical protein
MKRLILLLAWMLSAIPLSAAVPISSTVEIIPSQDNLGLAISSPPEKLTVNGVLAIKELTAPSASSAYGKLYVKATDSSLYFLNDTNTEVRLTKTSGSNAAFYLNDLDDAIYYPSATSLYMGN